MREKIESGQAVSWMTRASSLSMGFVRNDGVVIQSDENGMVIVPVEEINAYTICNDDQGATEESCYNVRLQDCPPPFSNLCRIYSRGCYADANKADIVKMSYPAFYRKCDGQVIEPDDKVSDRDMQSIRSAMGVSDQLQKELGRGRGHEFDGKIQGIGGGKQLGD